jgi:hypothetical protein
LVKNSSGIKDNYFWTRTIWFVNIAILKRVQIKDRFFSRGKQSGLLILPFTKDCKKSSDNYLEEDNLVR